MDIDERQLHESHFASLQVPEDYQSPATFVEGLLEGIEDSLEGQKSNPEEVMGPNSDRKEMQYAPVGNEGNPSCLSMTAPIPTHVVFGMGKDVESQDALQEAEVARPPWKELLLRVPRISVS